MKNKLKPITPFMADKLKDLQLEPEDLKIIIESLTTMQKYRLTRYENSMGEKINSKRLFLFLCNLIDFTEIKSKNS